jgi:hypothetical protein
MAFIDADDAEPLGPRPGPEKRPRLTMPGLELWAINHAQRDRGSRPSVAIKTFGRAWIQSAASCRVLANWLLERADILDVWEARSKERRDGQG